MSIKWPADLVNDIARRRCVLVLGAGISCNSVNAAGNRPKSWADFLNHAIAQIGGSQAKRRAIQALVRKFDFLTACQVIRDDIGNPAFHQLAQAEFLAPGFQPAPIHDRIIALDSRIVATPNFDTIYENRVNHIQHNSVAVKHYYDNDVAESVRTTGRIVLKIHGSINTPNKMIFTRDDYTRARTNHANFYSILDALAITHTFLFLGCGLDDPDIRLLLEDYGFKHEHTKPHFFVLPSGKVHGDITPAVEKSLNIKCLHYAVKSGSHSNLLTGIKELKKLVDTERNRIAAVQDW